MQRIGTIGWRRIVYYALPVLVLVALILIDQLSKSYFAKLYRENGTTTVIEDFFFVTYHVNTGAAWGFLSNTSWGITFFIILTAVALVGFVLVYAYSVKKKRTWLTYSMAFVIGGTLGNFIDRAAFGGVTDFLSFKFFGYHFPIFNFADSFLVVGVIMLAIYFLFLDKNAVFRKSNKKPKETDNDGKEDVQN